METCDDCEIRYVEEHEGKPFLHTTILLCAKHAMVERLAELLRKAHDDAICDCLFTDYACGIAEALALYDRGTVGEKP